MSKSQKTKTLLSVAVSGVMCFSVLNAAVYAVGTTDLANSNNSNIKSAVIQLSANQAKSGPGGITDFSQSGDTNLEQGTYEQPTRCSGKKCSQ